MADLGVAEDVVVHVRVARGDAVGAGDDDPLAVAIDDVVVDRRVLCVGVELDPAIGVAVDQVPRDRGVGRGTDVQPVLAVGRGKTAAVVNPVVEITVPVAQPQVALPIPKHVPVCSLVTSS